MAGPERQAAQRWVPIACVALMSGLGTPVMAFAADACPDDARHLALTFESGAAWSLCARLDPAHGLSIADIAYRAPGDRERPVLDALHPAAVLIRDHDRDGVRSLFTSLRDPVADAPCPGELEPLPGTGIEGAFSVCVSRHTTGLLTRFGDIRGRQGAEWRVELTERIEGQRWLTRIAFGESGRLTPRVSLGLEDIRSVSDPRFGIGSNDASLELERSLLVSWRIAPALDAPSANRIDEFDFTLESGPGSRRVMTVRALPFEALRPIAPERFRGWRVVADGGSGYYLDSQVLVSGWPGGGGNWTRFALAVTARNDCEREAAAAAGEPRCDAGEPASLDRWIDGQALDGAAPVLWFSQAVLASPGIDDGTVGVQFDLLPFDWTARSPFAPETVSE